MSEEYLKLHISQQSKLIALLQNMPHGDQPEALRYANSVLGYLKAELKDLTRDYD